MAVKLGGVGGLFEQTSRPTTENPVIMYA